MFASHKDSSSATQRKRSFISDEFPMDYVKLHGHGMRSWIIPCANSASARECTNTPSIARETKVANSSSSVHQQFHHHDYNSSRNEEIQRGDEDAIQDVRSQIADILPQIGGPAKLWQN
jgi:hypothetical protein